jgi:starvation-inducible DNA-binding protein
MALYLYQNIAYNNKSRDLNKCHGGLIMNRPKIIHNPLKKSMLQHLSQVTSTTYALFLKTQNYHWHVTGPHFHSLHLLFESQYQALYAAIDILAEHIRALGEKAPATLKEFSELSKVTDGNAEASWEKMVQHLHQDHQTMITLLTDSIKVASNMNDQASLDLLVERLREHQKHAWMLTSLLD